MTTIDYGSTPYSKLKRQQLLTLAYALEDMRDRAIERYETAEAALERVRKLAEADQKCPACTGYENILRYLDGEATDA